jgi:hypothetical protein
MVIRLADAFSTRPGSPGSAGASVGADVARAGHGGEVARASGFVRGARQGRGR